MFRLLAVLGLGLFLALLIGGRDTGQMRMGLAGYYPPLVAPAAPRAPAEETVAQTAPPAPAAVVVTEAAFEPAPAPSAEVQPGLTLALPLVRAAANEAANDAAPDQPTAAAPLAEGEILGVAYVTGSNVNIRETPSAKANVVEKLTRGEAVTVLASDTPGWSMIRIEGDGLEGYVASRYLTDAAQDGAALAAD